MQDSPTSTDSERVTLRAGTRVRIAERPHSAWYTQSVQGGGKGWQAVFGEQGTIWVAQGEIIAQTAVSNLMLDW